MELEQTILRGSHVVPEQCSGARGLIVGTAGHVDHGKTALVRALTGVDTDRLKEEKARGITIDLGFAYMPVSDGATVGFVDVPGHERLVRTMVAGAAGIDLALLVVAADDGVMPQTREHLDILGLLGLSRAIVVITKCDRVDTARRATVADEIANALAGTALAAADMVFVSVVSGEGIAELRQMLAAATTEPHRRRSAGIFRLSIDRSFSLAGVGTVAAGLVLDGSVARGDEVNVVPGGMKARVRSLHAQNRTAERGRAGERCALALVGIAKESVPRGVWLCGGTNPAVTTRCDADVRLLAGAAKPLRQWAPVHFHCGASDVPARVVVISSEMLAPGAAGLAQIILDRPLPLRHGDLFVLRDQSAQSTIGGGRVIDPRAVPRKRRAPERLLRLAALRATDPVEALGALLAQEPGIEDLAAFVIARGMTTAEADGLRAHLDLTSLPAGKDEYVCTQAVWSAIGAAVVGLLAAAHAEHPDLPGLTGEQLRIRMSPILPKPLFAAVRDRLLAEMRITLLGHVLHLPGHVAKLGAEERRLADLMTPLIAKERFRPPRVRDLSRSLVVHETAVRRACKALVRVGDYLEIGHDRFFLRDALVEMAELARDLTQSSGSGYFAAADFRDRLDNGRKVAIEILEYFDHSGLTQRQGDLRRVVQDPATIFGAAPR